MCGVQMMGLAQIRGEGGKGRTDDGGVEGRSTGEESGKCATRVQGGLRFTGWGSNDWYGTAARQAAHKQAATRSGI